VQQTTHPRQKDNVSILLKESSVQERGPGSLQPRNPISRMKRGGATDDPPRSHQTACQGSPRLVLCGMMWHSKRKSTILISALKGYYVGVKTLLSEE
jgi:hypothetical protein